MAGSTMSTWMGDVGPPQAQAEDAASSSSRGQRNDRGRGGRVVQVTASVKGVSDDAATLAVLLRAVAKTIEGGGDQYPVDPATVVEHSPVDAEVHVSMSDSEDEEDDKHDQGERQADGVQLGSSRATGMDGNAGSLSAARDSIRESTGSCHLHAGTGVVVQQTQLSQRQPWIRTGGITVVRSGCPALALVRPEQLFTETDPGPAVVPDGYLAYTPFWSHTGSGRRALYRLSVRVEVSGIQDDHDGGDPVETKIPDDGTAARSSLLAPTPTPNTNTNTRSPA